MSIIVPVHNVERWLSACLDSILRQEGSTFEIICINDGSEDSSRDILASYSSVDSRVLVITQPNRGLSTARNVGINVASGRYIVFLDGDDYWRIDALADLVTMADKESLDLLAFDAIPEREQGVKDSTWSAYSNYYTRTGEYAGVVSGIQLMASMRENWDYLPSAWLYLTRREFLADSNVQFIPKIIHEDNPYTFALFLKASRALHLPVPLHGRRVRPGSIVTSAGRVNSTRGHIVAYADMVRQLNETPVKGPLAHSVANIVSSLIWQAANNAVNLTGDQLDSLMEEMGDASEVVAYSSFRALRNELAAKKRRAEAVESSTPS